MAYVNFYIDKPFDPSIDKKKLKSIIENCDRKSKPYPKTIFNPKANALYLFFTYEKGRRLKVRTNIKVKGEQWNFKEGCFRSHTSGSLELNNELNDLTTKLLKNYSRFKEERSIIREEEVKAFTLSVVNGNVVISRNTFEKATEQFFEKKRNILTEGTFKEYRTVFKSLKEFEQKYNLTLKFEDFNQVFFNTYELFHGEQKKSLRYNQGAV